MLSFLAMLFTLRIGLGGMPVDGAVTSLRQESLTVASMASHPQTSAPRIALSPIVETAEPPRAGPLTERDWRNIAADVLKSETLANAVMWMATQPLGVSVGSQKVVVTVRVATP